jgi:hypothetical protein
MGKFVKGLTDLTCHLDPRTRQIVSVTIKVKDIKLLADKNGFIIAAAGKMQEAMVKESRAN